MTRKAIERDFLLARARYFELGVDVETAIKTLATIPISIHCWQGMMSVVSKPLEARWAAVWQSLAIILVKQEALTNCGLTSIKFLI